MNTTTLLPAFLPHSNVTMSSSSPRTYAPIWEKLKRDGVCSITANRLLHPRIVKAVIKEKWLDLVYKFDIGTDTAWLTHTRNHAVLTFYLTRESRWKKELRSYRSKDYFIDKIKRGEL